MPATQSTNPDDTRKSRTGEADADQRKPARNLLTAHNLKDLQTQAPEWCPMPELGPGVGIYIRPISAIAKAQWEAERDAAKERGEDLDIDLRERLIAEFACDADGEKVFTPAQIKDIGKLSAAAIVRVSDRICEIAGWIEADIEDMAGN